MRKKGSGRKPKFFIPTIASKVNNIYRRNPSMSVRDAAIKAGTSKSTIQPVIKKVGLLTYKAKKVPDSSSEQHLIAKKRARKLYDNYMTKFQCCIIDD